VQHKAALIEPMLPAQAVGRSEIIPLLNLMLPAAAAKENLYGCLKSSGVWHRHLSHVRSTRGNNGTRRPAKTIGNCHCKAQKTAQIDASDDSNAADFIKAAQKKDGEAFLESFSVQDLGIRYRSLLCHTQTVCSRAASMKLGEQRDNAEFVDQVRQIFQLYLALQIVEADLTEKRDDWRPRNRRYATL
jgi:hypothetical protein